MKKIVFIIPNVFTNEGMESVTIQIANEISKLKKYHIDALSLVHSEDTPQYKIYNPITVNCLPFENFSLRKEWLHAVKEI